MSAAKPKPKPKQAPDRGVRNVLIIAAVAVVGYVLYKHSQAASSAQANQYVAGTSPFPQPASYMLIQPSGESNVSLSQPSAPPHRVGTLPGSHSPSPGRGGVFPLTANAAETRNTVPFGIPAGYGRHVQN